jgi:predicted nucleic acid-binding protein
MLVLVDSNILVFSADPNSPFFSEATRATALLLGRGEELCVFPQNLIEFWVVATRPVASRGLGFSAAQAQGEIARIKSIFRLLPDSPAVYSEWEKLVTQHAVLGKNAHDARLAAAMQVSGVGTLLTADKDDFKRFQSITAMEPKEVK